MGKKKEEPDTVSVSIFSPVPSSGKDTIEIRRCFRDRQPLLSGSKKGKAFIFKCDSSGMCVPGSVRDVHVFHKCNLSLSLAPCDRSEKLYLIIPNQNRGKGGRNDCTVPSCFGRWLPDRTLLDFFPSIRNRDPNTVNRQRKTGSIGLPDFQISEGREVSDCSVIPRSYHFREKQVTGV